jgi:endoglucanase
LSGRFAAGDDGCVLPRLQRTRPPSRRDGGKDKLALNRWAVLAQRITAVAILTAAAVISPTARGQILYTGVNLSGAEFGATNLPGTFGTDYTYPTDAEVNYYISKEMNTFRLPIRWERLQPTPNSPLNTAEFNRLNAFVTYATSKGAHVIIDPHNFARYYPPSRDVESSTANVVGSSTVPNSEFADFWSRLATAYAGNSNVIFNLMNEPNIMPTEQWVSAANTAIAAIRTTGANNLILVPGNGYTGAWTWYSNSYGTPNATAMLSIVDSKNNFAIDVHQYLDPDGSGTSAAITNNDPMIGVERLTAFTQWLQANHLRGFLGEFAVAASTIGPGPTQIGDETLQNMLGYIQSNSDVWLGWTWWGGGPWWPSNYMFLLDPVNGVDQPQMAVIQPYFAPVPEPGTLALVGIAAAGGGAVVRWRRQSRKATPPTA